MAAPLRVAVIVPAEKFPEASRATTLEAVLAEVASTVAVTALEPLKLLPVRYVPKVNAFATEPAEPEILPDTADPLIAMLVLVTLVTCPLAFVVNTGTEDAEPYVPAVPVGVILNSVPDSVRPVPAVYSVESLI